MGSSLSTTALKDGACVSTLCLTVHPGAPPTTPRPVLPTSNHSPQKPTPPSSCLHLSWHRGPHPLGQALDSTHSSPSSTVQAQHTQMVSKAPNPVRHNVKLGDSL